MTERMDTCGVCRFYRKFPAAVSARMGECRRHAPVALEANRIVAYAAPTWPQVDDDDWCGEFELQQRRG